MKNEVLLAKSNFKKTKGSSIGIICLLTLISFIMCLVLLIMVGFKPQAKRFTEAHNPPTVALVASYNDTMYSSSDFTNYFDDAEDVSGFSYYEGVSAQINVAFGKGTMLSTIFVESIEEMKSRNINEIVVVSEDETITENYIYVPYVLHTSGDYNLGDEYTLNIPSDNRILKIKGFYDAPCMTNFQYGVVNFGVDKNTLDEMILSDTAFKGICLYINIDNEAKANKVLNDYNNTVLLTMLTGLNCYGTCSSKGTLENRTFMSNIISVAFLSVSAILVLVVAIMLTNSLANYIKENMKEIGALKAIGYKSINIRISLLIQFIFMAVLGAIIGILLSYIAYPIMAKILNSQTGIMYKITFVPLAVFPTFGFVVVFIAIVIALCTIKIKKIEPIVALRDGVETHSFKKNFIPLSTSKLGVNLSLALKQFFRNAKQNIITGIIVIFLIFSGGLGIGMMYNFAIEPAYGLLTFEVFDGLITTANSEDAKLVRAYLEEREDVQNLRSIFSMTVTDENDGQLFAYIVDDPSLLRNNPIYKGKAPKYDNEIVVSGKYASVQGYKIGDEIKLISGSNTYSYLIVGLMQTTNNGGHEAFISEEAYNHICDTSDFPGSFWFDSPNAKKVINDTKDNFGDSITSTTAFSDIVESQLSLFVVISIIVAAVAISIAVCVMILVLYLLIKSLLHSKRYEYGTLKAVGYTSKELMLQTSISFMPSIIIGSLLGVVATAFLANPFMTICMNSFGIMKCNFTIPNGLISIYSLALVLISFGITYLLSRKIKNIEPYQLLLAE